MKCSMTGQETGDILIQVTAWAGCIYMYLRAYLSRRYILTFSMSSY